MRAFLAAKHAGLFPATMTSTPRLRPRTGGTVPLATAPSPVNGNVVTFDAAQIGKPSNECMCVLRSGRRGRREKGNSRHLVWLLRATLLGLRHVPDTTCSIADVHMPGMTGVELHRRLVDAGYAIPTILVTAYPDEVVKDRALKDGVVCYLSKPVDDDHLERCLRSALRPGTPIEENS